ncbi:testis-expressed protein 51 isoform X1 [Dasypus novemcinctus]|uniref:testis-expressed protein 51 isoform X1 n=1 Tax=Dasypus novemcinctus TaxID=9361 RepID=UPI00265E43A4|nr:testis-expressed protein 51 isoform X1 [Dasypus novemcinctus]
MLLLVLCCLLPAAGAKNCLQCWEALPALMDYDLQVLWGTPGPPVELSQSLHALFLEQHLHTAPWYLARDHLEEEMARFFKHIDEVIMTLRDDKAPLLLEVDNSKKVFLDRLNKLSKELKEKACNKSCELHFQMKVTNCISCRQHHLSCHDPTLCPAWKPGVVTWLVGTAAFLCLAAVAGGIITFSGARRRSRQKKRRATGSEDSEERRSRPPLCPFLRPRAQPSPSNGPRLPFLQDTLSGLWIPGL